MDSILVDNPVSLLFWPLSVLTFLGLLWLFHRPTRAALRTVLVLSGSVCLLWLISGSTQLLVIIPLYLVLTWVSWVLASSSLWAFWIVVLVALLIVSKLSLFPDGGGGVDGLAVDRGIWLGFSYLAFRLIHLTFEKHKGKHADATLSETIIYALHPASLIAGPIDRIKASVKAQRAAGLLKENLRDGIWRILVGLFTKFVIANTVFSIISFYDMRTNSDRPLLVAWFWLVGYSIYLLADFAAYSHIAIGVGRLMGLKLPENFDRPYQSPSVVVFWQRWHMSLSFWLRDYVFFPIARGLSRRLPDKRLKRLIQFVAHMTTMIAVGLWHGLTPAFLVWGVWHGLGMFLVSQFYNYRPPKVDQRTFSDRIRIGASIAGTYLFVTLGWVWFSTDFTTAVEIYAALFGF